MKKSLLLISVLMLSGCISLESSNGSSNNSKLSSSSTIIDGDLVSKKNWY